MTSSVDYSKDAWTKHNVSEVHFKDAQENSHEVSNALLLKQYANKTADSKESKILKKLEYSTTNKPYLEESLSISENHFGYKSSKKKTSSLYWF